MRIHEIMTTDVQTISPKESAEAAFERMRLHRIHHLVVKDKRRVVGVLSEGDLRSSTGATVAERMTAPAITVPPTLAVREAANLMRSRSLGCLPVIEDRKLVGIVTLTDLLELLGRGGEPAARLSERWHPKHGSKWKPVRRMAHPQFRGLR